MCVFFSTELYYVNKVAQENYYTKDTQLNNVKHPFLVLYYNSPCKIFLFEHYRYFYGTQRKCFERIYNQFIIFILVFFANLKIFYSQKHYKSKRICFMCLMIKIRFCKRWCILTPEVFWRWCDPCEKTHHLSCLTFSFVASCIVHLSMYIMKLFLLPVCKVSNIGG